jgi:hypothetical protein
MKVVRLYASVGVALSAAFNLPSANAQGSDVLAVFEKQCADGSRADEFPFWEYVANNARRTADDYAMERNLRATFVNAQVDTFFQVAGDHAGTYLVMLMADNPGGTSFAVLRPNFPFCADPGTLDDSRPNLFTVVSAKFNGRSF